MSTNALEPTNSPLTDEQAAHVNRLITALSPDQLSWVSGYLAGLHHAQHTDPSYAQQTAAAERPTLSILYGSETGNAEALAQQAEELARARGLNAQAHDMADYKPKRLREESLLLVITATHGEGDAPEPAADFYEHLHGPKAPRLDHAKYAVLALGDSSYEHFCQTGKDFDERLAALGAERLATRVDCDVDFEETAERWLQTALDGFAAQDEQQRPDNVVAFAGASQPEAPAFDKRNPFHAEVLDNTVLNGRGSPQETRHIELSIEGSGIDYAPGDVLCVLPRNREAVISELLEVLALDAAESVTTGRGERTLGDALRDEYEITTLTPSFVAAFAERAGAEALSELVNKEDRSELMRYIDGRHVIDVVCDYPAAGIEGQTLINMLRRLAPREYSIASSHAANPGEVHITVATVRYETFGRSRHGVASTHLAENAAPGAQVPIYIRRNKNFRLPEQPNAATIMIGPGTGVAPFRAFVGEREEIEAAGSNWLFFGNPHHRTDFLYQTEWQRWLHDGVLTRMDVAFSRDGERKVYVQDRVREHGAELFRWLEAGAHLYVCGDAERMAPDVHAALRDVVMEQGEREPEAAAEYLKDLQRAKRYQRDVY